MFLVWSELCLVAVRAIPATATQRRQTRPNYPRVPTLVRYLSQHGHRHRQVFRRIYFPQVAISKIVIGSGSPAAEVGQS